MTNLRLVFARLGMAVCVLFWIIWCAGVVYDAANGTGANSRTYVAFNEEGAPVIHSFREGGDEYRGLRRGDVVLRIGQFDAAPVSQPDFRLTMAHADGDLTVIREGQRERIAFPMESYQFPLARVVKTICFGLLAFIVLFFGQQTGLTYVIVAALLISPAIGQGAPIGPDVNTSTLYAWLIAAGIAFGLGLLVNVCQLLVGETRAFRLALQGYL